MSLDSATAILGLSPGIFSPVANIPAVLTIVNTAAIAVLAAAGSPDAPTIGDVTPGNGEVTVNWTPPTFTGGSPITGYIITSTPPSTNSPFPIDDGAATSGIITGLTNATSYTFTVAAVNSVKTGLSSAQSASVTPSGVVPGAPRFVIVTPGNLEVTVSWTAPESDGGSPITGYIITSDPQGGISPFTTPDATLSKTITGLTNGQPYTFTVVAVNGVSPAGGPPSEPSASVTPVTPATFPSVSSISFDQTAEDPPQVLFEGVINSNGGTAISSLGVVYSFTNPNPILNGEDVTEEVYSSVIQSGSFSLSFTVGQTGQLYARAYAINPIGPAYGSVIPVEVA
jgi:hypothetical protein